MNSEKAMQFRQMIHQRELILAVGARDALEARLIQRAGFDAIWSSGFAISASYGVPDASLITMKQFLDVARSIYEAVDIPIIADCDTGFGNAINVIYTVRLYEAAGMAAICIEDKKFPKDTSLLAGGRQEILPCDEFVGKIKAAVDTRKCQDFSIIARVEALIAGWSMDEALERAYRYAEAGADCILIHSKSKTPDEIVEFIRRWDGSAPLVIIPTNYPSLTEKEVKKLQKVRVVIYANQILRAAVKAQEHLLAQIRQSGGIHTIDESMVPVRHIFELQDVDQMKENEKKFLPMGANK
jgi:phosphonopyruvate hydrolase